MIRLLLVICLLNIPSVVLAKATNINEVTDLFDTSVESKDQYIEDLEGIRAGGISNIEKGESLQHIQEIDKSEEEASRLSSIRAVDLDEEGRNARNGEEYSFYDEGDFEPDLSKPGNREHKRDVIDIVNATAELLANLTSKLKELGVDCKTVRGPLQREPIYRIEVKREIQNNTEYDQFFCEEPRNQYSCKDSVSLTCKRKGKGYGEWEPRTIRFNGHVLHNAKENWGWAVHWKTKRWGWHIHSHHPQDEGWFVSPSESPWQNNPAAIIADARSYIAEQLGVSIEQIGEDVDFPPSGRGEGSINPVGHRWRVVWDEYEFGYSYRDAYDICEEWEEDWTEACKLK